MKFNHIFDFRKYLLLFEHGSPTTVVGPPPAGSGPPPAGLVGPVGPGFGPVGPVVAVGVMVPKNRNIKSGTFQMIYDCID